MLRRDRPVAPVPGTPSAGRVAFARSLSAGRFVLALVGGTAVLLAPAFGENSVPAHMTPAVVALAGAIAAREVVRWLQNKTDEPDPAMTLLDAVLAVGILVAVGDSAGPIGWLAISVPVMEALVWSGAVAAVLTWVSTAGVYVVMRAIVGDDVDAVLLDLLRHLGGSALIAIPVWAAGSVIGREIEAVDRTREDAQARAENVERLAEIGRTLSTATSTDLVLNALVTAGIDAGYDAADVVVAEDRGAPQVVRLAGSFEQGGPRASMLFDEAVERGVVATRVDAHAQGLHRCDLRSGVAALVTERGLRIVVRFWRRRDQPDGVDDLETARTIAAQAAIAWHQSRTRTELEERAETLAHRATHDPLTGLANRDGLLSFLDRSAYDMRGQLGLLYLDLDGFKAINDSLGHGVGDEVLRVVAHRLDTAVGGGFMARLGGDEFVAVVGSRSLDELAMIGSRLIEAIERPIDAAASAPLSASVGLALIESDVDVHTILRVADEAMYAAKRAGGGRLAVAGSRQGVA